MSSMPLLYHDHPCSVRMWHEVNFYAEFNRFEFKVFFLVWLPYQGYQKLSLPYYLPITGWKIIEFIPFPMPLVLCKIQSTSSRIWTRVTEFLSYEHNHYSTGTSYTRRNSDTFVLFQVFVFKNSFFVCTQSYGLK